MFFEFWYKSFLCVSVKVNFVYKKGSIVVDWIVVWFILCVIVNFYGIEKVNIILRNGFG